MARFTKAQRVLHAVRNKKTGCSLTYHKPTNTTTGTWYGQRDKDGWRPLYSFRVNGNTLERNHGSELKKKRHFEVRIEDDDILPTENARTLSIEEIVEKIFEHFNPEEGVQAKPTKIPLFIAKMCENRRPAHTLYKNGTCPCGHKIGKRLKENDPCPKCGDPL